MIAQHRGYWGTLAESSLHGALQGSRLAFLGLVATKCSRPCDGVHKARAKPCNNDEEILPLSLQQLSCSSWNVTIREASQCSPIKLFQV